MEFKSISILEKLKIEYCQFNPNPNCDEIDHNDCLIRSLMVLFPDKFKSWGETYDYISSKAKNFHVMPNAELIIYRIYNELVPVENNIYLNLGQKKDTVVIDVICDSRIRKGTYAILAGEHIFGIVHGIIYDMYEKCKFDNILLETVDSIWKID